MRCKEFILPHKFYDNSDD